MRKFYTVGFLILLCFDTFAQTSFKMAAVQSVAESFNTASLNFQTIDGVTSSLTTLLTALWSWVLRLLHEPWIYGAICSYVGAFITYMTLLKHAPIGPAFAATHMEIVTVMLVSVVFLHEKLTLLQIVGSVLIMAGIFCLGTEKSNEPKPDAGPTTPSSSPEAVKDAA